MVHKFACSCPLGLCGLGQLLEFRGQYLLPFGVVGELLLNAGAPLRVDLGVA
ncbi:hypothetical protein ACFOZ4_08640 [Hamadaea flava]|uniref:Uncharacterized protein n=1 Tax=Hamadaea flava TaxID=1742688 RepID=A0ABV8LJP3_9ACTN|nr:hypothetical protein [Hamadaea flava]